MEKNKAAQEMARMKWEKMSKEKQVEHIQKMVEARKSKREEKDLTN